MIADVTEEDLHRLRAFTADDFASTRACLAKVLGGKGVASGFWRFFSRTHPACGTGEWNLRWCRSWGLAPENVYSFGEDLFGNQLLIFMGRTSAYVLDHEDGECHDTQLSVDDLVEAVLDNGVGWLDFYANGANTIGVDFVAQVDWESHLHWVQPLSLGGRVSRDNVSIVERMAHLVGHERLWERIRDAAPGDEILPQ